MNPPFGDASLPSKPYLDDTYGDTKGDVYKAFVECFQARLVPAGYLGIISSRTGFFLGQSEDWRTRVVLRLFRPIVLADLGSGVLDAMVEVAAYVLRSLSDAEARDLTLSLVPTLEKVVRDRQDRFSLPKWQAARDGLKRHQAVAELEHLESAGFVQRCPGDIVRYAPLWRVLKAVTAPPEPVFPPLVCIRALAGENKGAVLADAGRGSTEVSTFVCDPAGFFNVSGVVFAYWVTEKVRQIFRGAPRFEGGGRKARVGLQTSDDFRFARLTWETPRAEDTNQWFSFAKGGTFSPYYADLHLEVNWHSEGRELKAWAGSLYNQSHWSRIIKNTEFYFRPGFTWPRRTNGLSVRVLPSQSVFADKGPAGFCDGDNSDELLATIAIFNSRVFAYLIQAQLARVELAQSFEIGMIQKTPFPTVSDEDQAELARLASRAWSVKRTPDTATATSHAFLLPALLAASGTTLAERAATWAARVRTSEETVAAIQAEIDDLAFRLYGLDAADRAALTATLATESTPSADADEDEEDEPASADAPALAADLLAYALGAVFGRWDLRLATGRRPAPAEPDPFSALPACPPGMLQNTKGLVAGPEDVPAAYPVRIPWDGILVDDPNHPLDIERRVREVIEIVWKDRAEAIEHEACEILGVNSLRDYFRKPSGFFADHLKRYSKSRRQAPIYWPLSTASGSYTLWIYYHRLNENTLHTALADFIDPKLKSVRDEICYLRGNGNQPARLQELRDLEQELEEFHIEIVRIIKLPWKPNLNDGALITASPLWKLFRLAKWQKDLKTCWEELSSGDYDWAHLAYTMWPDRVKEVCKTDRSIAIAHGLEHLCKVQAPKLKSKRKKVSNGSFEDLEA